MANTVQVGSIQEGRFYVKGSEGQLIEIKSGDEISIGDTIVADESNSVFSSLELRLGEESQIIAVAQGAFLLDSSLFDNTFANEEKVFEGKAVDEVLAAWTNQGEVPNDNQTASGDVTEEETAAGEEVSQDGGALRSVFSARDGDSTNVISDLRRASLNQSLEEDTASKEFDTPTQDLLDTDDDLLIQEENSESEELILTSETQESGLVLRPDSENIASIPEELKPETSKEESPSPETNNETPNPNNSKEESPSPETNNETPNPNTSESSSIEELIVSLTVDKDNVIEKEEVQITATVNKAPKEDLTITLNDGVGTIVIPAGQLSNSITYVPRVDDNFKQGIEEKTISIASISNDEYKDKSSSIKVNVSDDSDLSIIKLTNRVEDNGDIVVIATVKEAPQKDLMISLNNGKNIEIKANTTSGEVVYKTSSEYTYKNGQFNEKISVYTMDSEKDGNYERAEFIPTNVSIKEPIALTKDRIDDIELRFVSTKDLSGYKVYSGDKLISVIGGDNNDTDGVIRVNIVTKENGDNDFIDKKIHYKGIEITYDAKLEKPYENIGGGEVNLTREEFNNLRIVPVSGKSLDDIRLEIKYKPYHVDSEGRIRADRIDDVLDNGMNDAPSIKASIEAYKERTSSTEFDEALSKVDTMNKYSQEFLDLQLSFKKALLKEIIDNDEQLAKFNTQEYDNKIDSLVSGNNSTEGTIEHFVKYEVKETLSRGKFEVPNEDISINNQDGSISINQKNILDKFELSDSDGKIDSYSNSSLKISGGIELDFSRIKDLDIKTDEIDLGKGNSGTNILNLSLEDVLKIKPENSNYITIKGDKFDKVSFAQNDGWVKSSDTHIDDDNISYDIYTNTGDLTVQVRVEQNIISDGITS